MQLSTFTVIVHQKYLVWCVYLAHEILNNIRDEYLNKKVQYFSCWSITSALSVCFKAVQVDPRGARPVEHGTRSEKCASEKEWPFCTTDEWVRVCLYYFTLTTYISWAQISSSCSSLLISLPLSFIRALNVRRAAGSRVWWTSTTTACWRGSRRSEASWMRTRSSNAPPTQLPNRPTTTWRINSPPMLVRVSTLPSRVQL